MRIIEQSATILDWSGLDLYERVEQAARVCRRSEAKGDAEGFVRGLIAKGHFPPLEFARIKTGLQEGENVRRVREKAAEGSVWNTSLAERLKASYPTLVDDMDSVREGTDLPKIEPADDWIPVLITTSRTISHQLVRYRRDICFMQESQRHVRYDLDGIEVIEPPGLNQKAWACAEWEHALEQAENSYINMMRHGATAEQARSVLPGCVATRILAYASPEEWRHIFGQRCDAHADPQMSALMIPLRDEMLKRGLI